MILHFLKFFYAGHPWYAGNVYGNVFVVAIVAPLGWLWSRTKFWPLRPMRRALSDLHVKFDAHRTMLEVEHQRRQEHDRWVHDAILAIHRGDHPPAHPHYD